jgi:hypothetical protein
MRPEQSIDGQLEGMFWFGFSCLEFGDFCTSLRDQHLVCPSRPIQIRGFQPDLRIRSRHQD